MTRSLRRKTKREMQKILERKVKEAKEIKVAEIIEGVDLLSVFNLQHDIKDFVEARYPILGSKDVKQGKTTALHNVVALLTVAVIHAQEALISFDELWSLLEEVYNRGDPYLDTEGNQNKRVKDAVNKLFEMKRQQGK